MNIVKIRNEMRNGRTIFDLPLRVTFYARVSTDRDEQLNSLENQVQYYTELIQSKRSWSYVPGYIDEGISGTSTKKRDSFLRMIQDAKDGRFDFIITKEISRFSRSTLDSIQYTQELLEHDVGVLFQNDNINTLDPDSEFRLVVMAGVAQDEVRKLSERLKFGFRQAIKNGHVLGNDRLWGYDKSGCVLTVNETEAQAVRRIFDLYANQQLGIRRISQILFDEGFTSRQGNAFNVLTIRHILCNPKYKGWYCGSKSQSPVHTVEKYVEMCKELKTMGFDTICLKDMAGTMSPYEAEHLIKGIKDAVGDMPLILHTHCTTGMAYMTVTKAIESGIDVIDCATSCFSNGTSQPATETMFYALQQYGIKTGLNEDVINKVNDFFKPVKQKYVDSGRINAKSMATDAQALVYKVPGGMLSNMIANLTDMKAMDKFEAALAEIPAVRKDLGYPPLVTPLSQMVGNQAVTNVLLGQRYKQVSKEVKNYFKGEYGIAPAPVSKELETQILGEGGKPVDCRIEDAKRTGEDFKKAKEALGDLARSEEDIMSYICYPDQTMKFLTDRKAKEENICKYSIVEA